MGVRDPTINAISFHAPFPWICNPLRKRRCSSLDHPCLYADFLGRGVDWDEVDSEDDDVDSKDDADGEEESVGEGDMDGE